MTKRTLPSHVSIQLCTKNSLFTPQREQEDPSSEDLHHTVNGRECAAEHLLLPGCLFIGPGESSGGLVLGARDLTGVGTFESV